MSELQTFVTMLERIGIGHGKRHDYNPDGESIQVEHPNSNDDGGFMVSDWQFDAEGKLKSVKLYEGEEG